MKLPSPLMIFRGLPMSFAAQLSNRCSVTNFISCSRLQLSSRRITQWRQGTVRLFAGLAVVSTLWGCGVSYSERIWDRGLRPVIQVIPERDWAAEVPMCPSCLATTTKLPLRNYLIKVRWGQWETLEHEFQHIWEWETTGTTDHIILLHGKNPMHAANSQEKKQLTGHENQEDN
jgi:hypothetical protein